MVQNKDETATKNCEVTRLRTFNLLKKVIDAEESNVMKIAI